MSETQYRMPAEWESQAGTWLAWPHERLDWPGRFTPIPWVYTEMIRVLAEHGEVFLVVRDPAQREYAHRRLKAAEVRLAGVHFYQADTNRSWLRDSGPIFVYDPAGQKVALDWRFNAWAKYDNYQKDDELPRQVAAWRGALRVQPTLRGQRVVLEGGSIDVNGEGVLLTTEECLLSPIQERNPGYTRADYEAVFKQYFGVEHVLWLHRGIHGDDTHGHIDDLARFVAADTIVAVREHQPDDPNYELLEENWSRLRQARTPSGTSYRLIELPMPRLVRFQGTILPASYANFLIANEVVIMPTFNDPADRVALATLQDCFPTRKVVGIHSRDLIWGLGTLHCMTQQEPR
jgi:agmatine deiminase